MPENNLAGNCIGSITSRCSGKEPALLPRRHFWGRNDTRERRKSSLAIVNKTKTYEANWLARDSMLSSSKLVVGSSRVNIPQFKQNVSARANLIINDARTYWKKMKTTCISLRLEESWVKVHFCLGILRQQNKP